MFRRFVFLIVMTFSSPAAADHLVDGVPLPSDVKIASVENADAANDKWLGVWVGAWGNMLKHILVVQSVSADGDADVIYAIGENPAIEIKPAWTKHKAVVSGDTLTITQSTFSATYKISASGGLRAKYVGGNNRAVAMMAKAELATIIKPSAKLEWKSGTSELVQTDLMEGGKPVRLEIVTYKPAGPGPFPLAVINHGSTGRGNNEAMFTQTWSSLGLASFLTERGWMVAFPQRRGRGKSDGLYDEGFAADRTKGYTCEADISVAGAERALVDLDAAITVLKQRPDVAQSLILIGGTSRGGILSVAYAGLHPEGIHGVINFVGGWMGDLCPSASQINQTLFKKGADFSQNTLWLYGKDDPYYSIEHSQGNFEAFQKAGGKGGFHEFDVPGNFGHFVSIYEELWSNLLDQSLKSWSAAR